MPRKPTTEPEAEQAEEPTTEPEAKQAEETAVAPIVAALLEEKRGYEARGLDDRVKQVDAAVKAAQG